MSTPTTATATLPHSHYNPHHYPYSHHQHQPYSQSNPASYRPTNPILPPASRLPFPTSLSSRPASHGISLVASSKDLELAPLAIRADTNYTTSASSNTPTMAAAVAHSRALPEPQQTRKRRRSRGPDWEDFYKNGLPKEVIVIDDTPEPETPTSVAISSSTQLTNGRHANGSVNGASNDLSRHVAKKRRRNDETAHYDPVYHNNIVGSHTSTPRRIPASPSKSTVSSDRTNSAIHTTAATSLGSLSSSNGQYDHDAQPGQKRKRTRQQIAIEARRRETGALTETYTSYRPPPYPPKKAADVPVKVIADVRNLFPIPVRKKRANDGHSQHAHNKNVRVDDDDGHYIVVPDNDLTDRCQCPLPSGFARTRRY